MIEGGHVRPHLILRQRGRSELALGPGRAAKERADLEVIGIIVSAGFDPLLFGSVDSQPERVYPWVCSIFIVILGLDPRIQGLSKRLSVALDCRVKPGNDNKSLAQCLDLQPEKLNRTPVGQARDS